MNWKNLSFVVLAATAISLEPGCKWFHEAEADRHGRAAEAAAKEGNFGKMIDEGKKADKQEKAAERAPLP